MFAYLFPSKYWGLIGPIFTLITTYIALRRQNKYLPTDGGRAFAVDGASAKGKPTSAGIIFISCMIASLALFTTFTIKEAGVYLFVLCAAIFGFLDDQHNWSAMKKALTDIFVALGSAALAALLFPKTIYIFSLNISFTIPFPLYIVLAALLVWLSINFTNASDGVDGLCGGMSMVATITFILMTVITAGPTSMIQSAMIYLVPVLGVYLWFNCHPSTLLMGDSGSQAIGVLLALFAMATANPFSYIIICLPLICDGGSSLLKLAVLRATKKKLDPLKGIRTPLHDHCRKELGWANQKVTERFILLHVAISSIYILILLVRCRI